jgi:hypothetical protein
MSNMNLFERWFYGTCSSMMFRVSALKVIFPEPNVETKVFYEIFRKCSDFYLVFAIRCLFGYALIDKQECAYRRHGGNLFSTNQVLGYGIATGKMSNHPELISAFAFLLYNLSSVNAKAIFDGRIGLNFLGRLSLKGLNDLRRSEALINILNIRYPNFSRSLYKNYLKRFYSFCKFKLRG